MTIYDELVELTEEDTQLYKQHRELFNILVENLNAIGAVELHGYIPVIRLDDYDGLHFWDGKSPLSEDYRVITEDEFVARLEQRRVKAVGFLN